MNQLMCKAEILYNQSSLPENIKNEIELWLNDYENSILTEIYETLNIPNEKRIVKKIEYYDIYGSYSPMPIYEAKHFDNLEKYDAYIKTVFLKLENGDKHFIILDIDTCYKPKTELIKSAILELEDSFNANYLKNGKKLHMDAQLFKNFKDLLLNRFIGARYIFKNIYY